MQFCGRSVIALLVVALAFISGAYAIELSGGFSASTSGENSYLSGTMLADSSGVISSVSSSDNKGTSSYVMDLKTDNAAINSLVDIVGSVIIPNTHINGPISTFTQTHQVTDKSGKKVQVYVNVVNAPNGLDYSSLVLPSEGALKTIQTSLTAEQWLTVPKADSIKCTATASYGKTLSVDVGIQELKGRSVGDYVTLTDYYDKAFASATQVEASQTAINGAANSITIYGTTKDSSGTYSVNTPLRGISDGKAMFSGLSETSSAGTATQVVQNEHVHGTFTSTATYTPTKGTKETTSRASNYGIEYDLNMKAAKGSSPTGTVGYYVDPTTSANTIQSAVNVAQSGDTINVASGKYIENVKIDKSLTIMGAGATNTIVDGNKADSVFAIGMQDPNVDVTLSGMTATNGNANDGGGIVNRGTLALTGVSLTDNAANNGGGICNIFGTVIMDSGSITRNIANNGGGICNFYGTVNLKEGSVTGNTANNLGGGIYSGGICNSDTVNLKIDGTQVVVKFNKAGRPSPSELSWYEGWGIYLNTGTPTITCAFDPATQVTDNTLI